MSRNKKRSRKPSPKPRPRQLSPAEQPSLGQGDAVIDDGRHSAAKFVLHARLASAARGRCAQLSAEATAAEARARADAVLTDAEQRAHELTAESKQAAQLLLDRADSEARRYLDEAGERANTVLSEASLRAESLRAEAEADRQDAERCKVEAEEAAGEARAEAQRAAEEVLQKAGSDAEEIVEAARRKAESTRADAAVAAERRRENAEKASADLRKEAQAEAARLRKEAAELVTAARSDAAEERAAAQSEVERVRRESSWEAERRRAEADAELADAQRRAEALQVEADRKVKIASEDAGRAVADAEAEAKRLLEEAKRERAALMKSATESLAQAKERETEADAEKRAAKVDREQAAELMRQATDRTERRLARKALRENDRDRRRDKAKARKLERNRQRDQRRAERPSLSERTRRVVRQHARQVMVVGPITAPMAVAWTGQAGFAEDVLGWVMPFTLLFAAGWELSTTFVGWMYHEARKAGDAGTVYRVATWVFASGAAVMNYWHASGAVTGRTWDWSQRRYVDHITYWHATPKAVSFAAMSLVGIILWELYASLLHRKELRKKGMAANARPKIPFIRWLRFPRQAFTAWSLAITDASLTTLDLVWDAAEGELARKRAMASARAGRPLPRTYRVVPITATLLPTGVPAFAGVQVGLASKSGPALRAETERRDPVQGSHESGLSEGETDVPGESEKKADETGPGETETKPRETSPPESETEAPAEIGAPETQPPTETEGESNVVSLSSKQAEIDYLVKLMRERGGPKTVSLEEAKRYIKRSQATVDRRLRDARELVSGSKGGKSEIG
ncbi:hypothetical protein ABR737_00970 [Streptomyces sp. Edi2]|uniref:hypothetical protein n=1 Tax=Streptomyces sp. Edi2 TaxID=3162528 RepID=UPI003305F4BC